MGGVSDNFGAYNYIQSQTEDFARDQELAYQAASGRLQDFYDTQQESYQPTIDIGDQSLDLQAAFSGALGSEAQAQAYANDQMSPGVQWAREQGLRGIDQDSAASGRLLGGDRLKAVQAYGTGVAQQDFNNQFNRLGMLSNMGQQARTNLGNIGSNVTSQQANLEAGIGDAYAQAGLAGTQNFWQGNQAFNQSVDTTFDALGSIFGMRGGGG